MRSLTEKSQNPLKTGRGLLNLRQIVPVSGYLYRHALTPFSLSLQGCDLLAQSGDRIIQIRQVKCGQLS